MLNNDGEFLWASEVRRSNSFNVNGGDLAIDSEDYSLFASNIYYSEVDLNPEEGTVLSLDLGESESGIYTQRFDLSFLNSTNQEFEKQNISLFPNPTNGILFIKGKVESIVLYDLSGREIFNAKSPINELNVSNIPQGTYLLQLALIDGSTKTEKVIIK